MIVPAVILSHPQIGENIGATARAMKNFGLSELRLIAPHCRWPNERAIALASGASDILEHARVYPDAASALSDVRLVLATTARDRDVLKTILTPQAAAGRLREAASQGISSAILFGGERAGLDNDEMSLADAVITIPTAEFSSLNLGQAVLLLGYEWLKSTDATPASRTRKTSAVPATRQELVDLFEHLERELDAGGFFFPAAKKAAMVRNMRAMIVRSKLSDQETRTIRGMIVALVKNKYRGEKDVTFIPFVGVAVIAILAVGFATFALWRHQSKGGVLLAGAIALFMLGVGGGTYWMIGRPGLAVRAAQGITTHDIRGLIPFLVTRVHKEPGDLQAWIYLARAYLTVNDASDAAKAYGRAVTVARLNGTENADLDSAYGEALVAANNDVMTDEAVAAFSAALIRNPKEPAARFFLGQARAERGDNAGALALWQSLLDDVPPAAPLHQILVDRMAMLTARAAAQGGAGTVIAPDPKQMVAGLAARLKDNPKDAPGWRRLIRAYTVLGQSADAKTALAAARKTFADDKDTLAALDADAKDLNLN